MTENKIPVNIEGGVNSIFDGAGAIKDVVSEDTVSNFKDKVDEYETEETAKQEMKAIPADEYYKMLRTKPIVRNYKKIGRNDPCPCGAKDKNGKPLKYKNCCMASGEYEGYHEVN